MVSFVILLIARTARIACADRHTHTHTHETTTVIVELPALSIYVTHSGKRYISAQKLKIELLVSAD